MIFFTLNLTGLCKARYIKNVYKSSVKYTYEKVAEGKKLNEKVQNIFLFSIVKIQIQVLCFVVLSLIHVALMAHVPMLI